MTVAAVVILSTAPAHAYPRPGRTERVNVSSTGAETNFGSGSPSVSGDGRYVAFDSAASNLVGDDNNGQPDVFVHDRAKRTTERVSLAADGAESGGFSFSPSISGDGRYVAFASYATNLVPGDTNGRGDVFVHDRISGTTERASLAGDGSQPNADSTSPAVSGDGSIVAFMTTASLSPADTNAFRDVYVRDLESGVTEFVSISASGGGGTSFSEWPQMSQDGRFVAFYSLASNIVPNDTNQYVDVFVRDRVAGTTERVSVATDGTQGNVTSTYPSISPDGRCVAFYSAASNLVPDDSNDVIDVFLRDRLTSRTERVSIATDGTEGTANSFMSAVGAGCRHVAFYSLAENLVPGDGNGRIDVFVRDRVGGVTEIVSVADDGAPGNATSAYPDISADGRIVAMDSLASLASDDTNGAWDVYVRDRGPDLGAGAVSATPSAGGFRLSGWATFSPAMLTYAPDPAGDSLAGPSGADLVEAAVVTRPEEDDHLVRLRLSALPGVRSIKPQGGLTPGTPALAGSPAVVYGLDLRVGGVRHEVRVLRASATRATAPSGALYRCEASCVSVATVPVVFGRTAEEVLAALPGSALPVGAALTQVRAFTAAGEDAVGGLRNLDEVSLPDVTVPGIRVEVGSGPHSASETDITFAPATNESGWFSASVEAPPGESRVWARACLGTTCNSISAPVTR